MMILKLSGSFLIIICCFAFGIKSSDRLKKYYESCKLIEEILNRISIMIRYRSMNIYGIISELKKSESFSEMEFIKNLSDDYCSERFSDLWKKAVNSDMNIGNEEKNLLISFGEKFGSSDIQGEISEIEMLSENIIILKNKRFQEYEKKGRLFRSVGLLAGIMTGILIL